MKMNTDNDKGKVISFKHSGDMGDIVSSLPTVRAICAKENATARMVLDATGGRTDPYVTAMTKEGNKFSSYQAEFLKPLLEAQEYVSEVKIDETGTEESDYNLNIFRSEFSNPKTLLETRQNLMYLHQSALGLPVGYDGPWLKVEANGKPEGTLIARSTRYQSAHLAIEVLIHEMNMEGTPYFFVGTALEYHAFKDAFRFAKPGRKIVDNALEMAKAVAEADTVICNGTLLFWIAVGLGHSKILHELANNIMTTHFHETKDFQGRGLPDIRYMIGGCLR